MPINPFVFRRIGLDTLPVTEGGMLPPFVTSEGRMNTGFDSNIFTYGTGGGVPGGGDGGGSGFAGGNVGGGFDPDYQSRLDAEALAFFQKQEADKQARLDEEARLAEEARIAEETRIAEEARAEQARLAEEARVAGLTGTATTPPTDLPGVVVNEGRIPGSGGYIDQVNQNIYNLGLIGPANDPANLGANPNKYQDPSTKTPVNTGDPIVPLEPFIANEKPIVQLDPITSSGGASRPFVGPIQNPSNVSGPTALDKFKVNETTIGDPSISYSGPPGPFVGPLVNPGNPTKLESFVSSEPKITAPQFDIPPVPGVLIKNFQPNVTYPPITDEPPVAIEEPPPPVNPPTIPTVPGVFGGTPSVPTTTGGTGQNLTIKRNFGAELEETLAALQKNQSGIMGMYGDLYKQFMPKGITESESGIIDQYKTDLGRLQQRQAGVLSPEDVRQSQQAAREAYGARGQVMGRGAVGAEILGRENIRQQREDQARAGLQASYGNVLNMANLQTGNIFSPIGNLMSNTFNPLSPYAADVYGTNVNAQLAKEIAQKNYDAAVRSAELQGSAAKSASNTNLLGDLLKVGGTVKIAMACMPGDQEIDTPNGPVPIQDLRGGDYVIGYDNTVKRIEQLSSYVENPETEFLKFALADGGSITVCGPHKILDIPAREWLVGSEMNGVQIVSITKVTGVTTSYDLMTSVGGYRIAGIPVNSMIPEMIAQTIEQVLLNRS